MASWSKERQALRSRYIRLAQWKSSRSNTLEFTVSDQTSLDSASLAGMDFLSARTAWRSCGNTCAGQGEENRVTIRSSSEAAAPSVAWDTKS